MQVADQQAVSQEQQLGQLIQIAHKIEAITERRAYWAILTGNGAAVQQQQAA